MKSKLIQINFLTIIIRQFNCTCSKNFIKIYQSLTNWVAGKCFKSFSIISINELNLSRYLIPFSVITNDVISPLNGLIKFIDCSNFKYFFIMRESSLHFEQI